MRVCSHSFTQMAALFDSLLGQAIPALVHELTRDSHRGQLHLHIRASQNVLGTKRTLWKSEVATWEIRKGRAPTAGDNVTAHGYAFLSVHTYKVVCFLLSFKY